MSEFHPNRTSPVKTKPGLTRRRLVEMWPTLIWVAVLGMAYWAYARGHVFSRMNGAVDVYQENITPAEDNRLLKILVKRGEYAPPGTVVAEMDSRSYRNQLSGILQGVAATRQEEILRLERQQLDLEAELRKHEIMKAEDAGRLPALIEIRDRMAKPAGSGGALKGVNVGALAADQLDEVVAEIGEIEGRQKVVNTNIDSVRSSLEKLAKIIVKMQADADRAAKADLDKVTPEVLAGLNDSERKDVVEMTTLIELCHLTTTKGGTVDRIEKEEGEFVTAGESVLRIVADPDQVVAFLPQDQIGQLHVGDQVWITPAYDRNQVFESTVAGISPRVNNLPDATSPLPNRRLYGRDVVINFPASAKGATPGQPGKLVPGQTVTVHVSKPGEIPLINRIFHNDDGSAQ